MVTFWEQSVQDFRLGARRLFKAPAFTIASMLTLGVGIGLNTIAFTLLNAFALRPMPVPEARRIVRVDTDVPGLHNFSVPDFRDYRDRARLLDDLAAYHPTRLSVSTRAAEGHTGEAERFLGYFVSENYFSLLGIPPTLGRMFGPGDEQSARPGGPAPAIVSYTFWTRRLDSNPQAIGQTLTINGRPFTIVGVGPREFMGTEPLAPDVWVPLTARVRTPADPDWQQDRFASWLLVVGRLRPGIARDAAEGELSAIARRLADTYPAPRRSTGAVLRTATFLTLDAMLWQFVALVMTILGLVLLVACANVGNLVLARAATRQREVSVRLALGSGRARLVRQLLAECLLLAAGGAAVGVVLSYWTLEILRPLAVSLLPFRWITLMFSLQPDLRVFAYTALVAFITGVTFGLAPALQAARLDLVSGLREEATALGVRWRQSRVRDVLVVVQIAVCLVLLVGAGLLTRALGRAQAVDVGFETSGVIYADVDLSPVTQDAPGAPAVAEFNRRLAERARHLPGVKAVSLASKVPLIEEQARRTAVRVDGLGADLDEEPLRCLYLSVSPEYFDTLRLSLVRGRRFSAADGDRGANVVISEALARRFWPGQDPLGQRINAEISSVPMTVVGVVRDAAGSSMWRDREAAIYLPIRADADQTGWHVLARVDGDPRAAMTLLRREARDIDPRALVDVATLDDLLRLYILPSRVLAIGAAVLSGIALLLATIGVYSVLAYVVNQRRAEIAVRMAMGAGAWRIARLVLGQGLTLVAIGIGVGLMGAFATSRVLRGALFGISPADPLTFAGVSALLFVIALIACYVPARRASRVDPMVALRME